MLVQKIIATSQPKNQSFLYLPHIHPHAQECAQLPWHLEERGVNTASSKPEGLGSDLFQLDVDECCEMRDV